MRVVALVMVMVMEMESCEGDGDGGGRRRWWYIPEFSTEQDPSTNNGENEHFCGR